MRVAFIGLGNMGLPMAANAAKAGHAVTGFDTIGAAREAAAARGIAVAPTAEAALAEAEAVVTMLPNGAIVRQVWTALAPHLPAGCLAIDCSTIDIGSAKAFHDLAAAREALTVDAPVSGGVGGAVAGTLTFMGGGTPAALEAAAPLLAVMGRTFVRCGGARRRPGGQDLQQHGAGRLDDRGLRGLRARRPIGPRPAGHVRRRLDLVGVLLVDQHLLPGAGGRPEIAPPTTIMPQASPPP